MPPVWGLIVSMILIVSNRKPTNTKTVDKYDVVVVVIEVVVVGVPEQPQSRVSVIQLHCSLLYSFVHQVRLRQGNDRS